jgi:hypothetical protein
MEDLRKPYDVDKNDLYIPVRKAIAAGYGEDCDLLFRGRDLIEYDPETVKEYGLLSCR